MPEPKRTKHGTWTVVYRDPSGRQRRRTFKKKTHASQFVHTIEVAKLKGEFVDPALGRTEFSDWYEQWDATRVHRRESTRVRDESVARNHVLPIFGSHTLAGIQKADFERFISTMTADGYSPATVRKAVQLVSGALEAAVDHGMIPRNPGRRIVLPKIEHAEMRFLRPEEILGLAEAFEPRYRALVLAAGYTGLRAGELAGLNVDALDLSGSRLSVAQTLSRVRGRLVVGPPKTKASRRTISLPGFLVEELRSHLAAYGWKGGFVFTSREGQPIHWTNFRRRHWQPATKQTGHDGLRFHDLRHTHAALLIAANEHPKVIQQRLGHASIRVTLDLYGHLFDGLDQGAATRLDTLFHQGLVTVS